LVAFFGSEGLFCFDLNGSCLWRQDLGLLDGGWSAGKDFHWGFGSSPIIYKNLVIVQCDTQTQSFLAAFNPVEWQTGVAHAPRRRHVVEHADYLRIEWSRRIGDQWDEVFIAAMIR
jgi:hypothetical protein